MAPTIKPVESSSPSRLGVERKPFQNEQNTKGGKLSLNNILTKEQVKELAGELNDLMTVINTRVSFSIDQKSNRPVIRVLDVDSGDVIRQIPPEELLQLSHKINELLGILFDDKG